LPPENDEGDERADGHVDADQDDKAVVAARRLETVGPGNQSESSSARHRYGDPPMLMSRCRPKPASATLFSFSRGEKYRIQR